MLGSPRFRFHCDSCALGLPSKGSPASHLPTGGLVFSLVLFMAGAPETARAQESSFSPETETVITSTRETQTPITSTSEIQTVFTSTRLGAISLTETGRESWGISEEDWIEYRRLLEGPAGLWYAHMSPAFVLGVHATSDSERRRYARMVHEQERERIERLLTFNRAVQDIARAERSVAGFSFFDVSESPAISLAGPEPSGRILVFVEADCPACERTVLDLADSGQGFDLYFVGAESDAVISRWARRIGLSAARVRSREITLNHDRGTLERAGFSAEGLPLLFRDPSLRTPVSLQEARQAGR